jgi:hypothetical protein
MITNKLWALQLHSLLTREGIISANEHVNDTVLVTTFEKVNCTGVLSSESANAPRPVAPVD